MEILEIEPDRKVNVRVERDIYLDRLIVKSQLHKKAPQNFEMPTLKLCGICTSHSNTTNLSKQFEDVILENVLEKGGNLGLISHVICFSCGQQLEEILRCQREISKLEEIIEKISDNLGNLIKQTNCTNTQDEDSSSFVPEAVNVKDEVIIEDVLGLGLVTEMTHKGNENEQFQMISNATIKVEPEDEIDDFDIVCEERDDSNSVHDSEFSFQITPDADDSLLVSVPSPDEVIFKAVPMPKSKRKEKNVKRLQKTQKVFKSENIVSFGKIKVKLKSKISNELENRKDGVRMSLKQKLMQNGSNFIVLKSRSGSVKIVK